MELRVYPTSFYWIKIALFADIQNWFVFSAIGSFLGFSVNDPWFSESIEPFLPFALSINIEAFEFISSICECSWPLEGIPPLLS